LETFKISLISFFQKIESGSVHINNQAITKIFIKKKMNIFLKTLIIYQILIKIIARAQNVLPSGCQEAFRVQVLALHNQYRAMHGTPPLASSSSLDTSALSWANIMATTGNFVHNAYGENLWANSDDSVLTLAKFSQLATLCVSSWYSEISSYPYNLPGLYSPGFYSSHLTSSFGIAQQAWAWA
jgi:uncharacterized protein YkwD